MSSPNSISSVGPSTELDPTRRASIGPWVIAGIAVIAGLIGLIFWPSLVRLWTKTNPFSGEANWAHAVFVPIIGLYYLYLNREALRAAGARPILPGAWTRNRGISVAVLLVGGLAAMGVSGWISIFGSFIWFGGAGLLVLAGLVAALDWGVGTLAMGLLAYGYGIWPGQNDYVKDLGLVITLFGIVLTLYGWDVMKIAWFPIAFLVCAIPWPGLLYSYVAGPLQELAAYVAAMTLRVTGVYSFVHGTKIIYEGADGGMRPLNVAEACAGLKSLMTFITVGGAVAFLSARPLWQKLVIVASAIPIAIACNVMRVAGQGLLDRYVSRAWSEGFAHQFAGLMMMVPAFGLLMLVGWILDRIVLDEPEPAAAAGSTATPAGASVSGAAYAAPAGSIAAVPGVTCVAQPASPSHLMPQATDPLPTTSNAPTTADSSAALNPKADEPPADESPSSKLSELTAKSATSIPRSPTPGSVSAATVSSPTDAPPAPLAAAPRRPTGKSPDVRPGRSPKGTRR